MEDEEDGESEEEMIRKAFKSNGNDKSNKRQRKENRKQVSRTKKVQEVVIVEKLDMIKDGLKKLKRKRNSRPPRDRKLAVCEVKEEQKVVPVPPRLGHNPYNSLFRDLNASVSVEHRQPMPTIVNSPYIPAQFGISQSQSKHYHHLLLKYIERWIRFQLLHSL